MAFIPGLPEWVCFIATLIFVLLSYEAGFKFGTRRRLRPGENPETAAGTLSGTTIGLLAFMLAFTFDDAASNHQVRKSLVIEEANAIRTTYQRSMSLPDPYRAEVRDLLREYVDVRLNAVGPDHADFVQAIDRTVAIQGRLWAITLEQKKTDVPMIGLFTESLNKVFDLHVDRFEAAFEGRIPAIIWGVLYFLTFVTMAMMGYRVGLSGIRSTFTVISMALAFAVVLLLIIALDRPNGTIKISQKPLMDVQNMLHAGR